MWVEIPIFVLPITATSNNLQDILIHLPLDCLFRCFVQAGIIRNIKALHHRALCKGNLLATSGYPLQRTSYVESVSIPYIRLSSSWLLLLHSNIMKWLTMLQGDGTGSIKTYCSTFFTWIPLIGFNSLLKSWRVSDCMIFLFSVYFAA